MKQLTLIFTLCLLKQFIGFSTTPNIIFILADDLGYSDLSCYGAKKIQTPHLDQLAKDGVKFDNFRTAASICSPSRAAFLTGAYPQRCGLYMGINTNREAHWYLGLHKNEITIAEQLKVKGYKTHLVGKWHLGHEKEFSYYEQGFDHYYGMPDNFSHDKSFYDEKELIHKVTPLDQLTELYTNRVKKIIKESEEPFFLYYSHNYPHTPYQAGPKFKGSSKDGVRGDIMQEFDWSIGEIINTLKQKGIYENTILIFTSDNGPTKNTYAKPFKGTKFVSYEGGHRVPFIFHWEGKTLNQDLSSLDINATDLFPTLSEIVGIPLPKDRVYDGTSLYSHLLKESVTPNLDRPFYYYNCENLQAIKVGNWKLQLPRDLKQIPWWDKNKKDINELALFDLNKDPSESNNVAQQYPEKVKELITLSEKVREELGEYSIRGKGQRDTGSLFPDVPVKSHPNDWKELPTNLKNLTVRK